MIVYPNIYSKVVATYSKYSEEIPPGLAYQCGCLHVNFCHEAGEAQFEDVGLYQFDVEGANLMHHRYLTAVSQLFRTSIDFFVLTI